jgi:SAM-dependent methyltransferase
MAVEPEPREPSVPCPACGTALTRERTRLPRGYVSCAGCSLARVDPLPDERAAIALFGPGYFAGEEAGHYPSYAADESVHRRNARRVLDLLGPPPVPGARLLDVGCGYGFLLDEARRHGWSVAGVDVSDHAREQARVRFGLDVAPDLDALQVGADGFAAVTSVQTLHHAVDPGALIAGMAARMRVGGLLALETLDRGAPIARLLGRRWPLPAAPWTLWLFDRPALVRISARHGLAVLDIRPSRKRISLRHLTAALATRSLPSLARRRRADLAERLGNMAVPYPFADTIVVLARREGS